MKELSEICVVSWDLDGTLYSMDAMKKVLIRQLITSVRRGLWSTKEATQLIALNAAISGCRGDTERVETFIQSAKGQRFLDLQSKWISTALADCGPCPNAVTTIQTLQEQGVRQVICTDYPVGKKLEVLGLESAFEHILVASDAGQLKPDAHVFQRLCRELSVAPHQVLHVGDRADTDGGAAAAGLKALILGRDIQGVHQILDEWGVSCR